MSSRLEEIQNAMSKLESFKSDPRYVGNVDMLYAIEENLLFLKAIHSLPRYFAWLVGHARHIDGARLKELTDFPVPEWDVSMHTHLIELQKKNFPGLIKPLVAKISEIIANNTNETITIADLGFGGMEIERQVIEWLIANGSQKKIIFIGVDKSATVHEIAKKNLAGLGSTVNIIQVDALNPEVLNKMILSSSSPSRKSFPQISVIMCKNDIFNLNEDFPPHYFDLLFHSLFKHHLPADKVPAFDRVASGVSKEVIEFDGYYSFPHLIPQSLASWKTPIFLNGTVFSMLRYQDKKDIKGENIQFFKNTAHYLKER